MSTVGGISHVGIRCRTASGTDPNQQWGAKSTLTNFYVTGDEAAITDSTGLFIGSSNVSVVNGYIENCYYGVVLSGNSNDVPVNTSVSQVSVSGSTYRAFSVGAGCSNARFVSCAAQNSVTGFRIEGTYSSLIACTGLSNTSDTSIASIAAPSSSMIGCNFSNYSNITVYASGSSATIITPSLDASTDNVDLYLIGQNTGGVELRSNGGRALRASNPSSPVNWCSVSGSIAGSPVSVGVSGTDTDIDIAILPKNAGKVRFGTTSSSSDVPITGYITIKDAGGTLRKLAVIA